MTGTIKRYTTNLNLRIPVFDTPGWGREIERNFDVLDAAIYSVSALANVQGIWSNGEAYAIADRIVDDTDNTVWICDVAHTSASTDTFAVDRAAHPTYWHQLSGVVQTRGAWTTATDYVLNDFVVNGNEIAVCVVSEYTSSATYAQDIVDGNLVVIIDLDPQLAAAAASAAAALVSENNAAASESAVAADQLTVAADKATVAADKATVAADKAIVIADMGTVAADKAIVAADKATVAADKATTATYKTDAQTAQTAAVVAQVAAEAALAATLTAYDNFDDRYLGAKATNPVVDNDGNALVAGMLYYNTVVPEMRLYTGAAWVAAYVSGVGYLVSANNLSDVANAATARANLGTNSALNITQDTLPDARLAAKYRPDSALWDSTTDIDTVTSEGWCGRFGSANANLPNANNFYIFNIKYSALITQIAYPYSNSGIPYAKCHMRGKNGSGGWSAWEEFLFKTTGDARYAQLSGATFTGAISTAGTITSAQNFISTGFYCILSPTGVGNVYLRPNGPSSTTNEFILSGTSLTVGGNNIHHDGNASRGAPDWVLEDQKASGTNGGTATSGSWFTRTLNTEVRDPLGLVTLSSDTFVSTVDGWVEFEVPAWVTNGHQARLYNVTDAVVVAAGVTGAAAPAGAFHLSTGGGPIVAGKTYRIEGRVITTKTTDGRGIASGFGTEVYTRVMFWRT